MELTKQEYLWDAEARLEASEAQIEKLMAQETRSDYREYLTNIRLKQESAQAKLAQLAEAEGETWQDLRSDVDQAIGKVEDILFVAKAGSE